MFHRIKKWAQSSNKISRTLEFHNMGSLVSFVLTYILVLLLLLSLDGSLPRDIFLIVSLFLLPITGFFIFLSIK